MPTSDRTRASCVRRRSRDSRCARPHYFDPLLVTLCVYVTLLWMLNFGGQCFLDDFESWRDTKAAVLLPLLGPVHGIALLTFAHVAWFALFALRAGSAWRARPRRDGKGLVVACIGILIAFHLQVMTVQLSRAMHRIDVDPIPSDATMIESLVEHRAVFDSWIPKIRSFESPAPHLPPSEWPFAFQPGGAVHDRSHIWLHPLGYGGKDPGRRLWPRRGWLVQDEGRRIHLAQSVRGIKPRFLIKGYYHGTRPNALRDSLDEIDEGAPGLAAYRHIEGDWYLFVLRTPVHP